MSEEVSKLARSRESEKAWLRGQSVQLLLYSKPSLMGSELSQEFNKVAECDRVDSLIDLVKQCSYQQKLEFTEKLHRIMYRDFLVELPKHISHSIVSYLTIDEACVCLLVCKQWNAIVSECTGFWEVVACEMGLGEAFMSDNTSKYKSIKDMCIAARSHQKYVSSLSVRAISVSRCPTDPRYNYYYAGKGVTLQYQEMNSHAQIIIEKMDTLNTPVKVASYTTSAFSSRVKWAAASDTRLIWKQIDGKWNSCSIEEGADSSVSQWDDEPVSQAFHSISICNTCHLVAIVSEAEDDCEVWDLQVVKLRAGKVAAKKTVYPIPLEHIQKSGAKIRHFLGGEITVLPQRPAKNKRDFCDSHCLLLQVDNSVAVHHLESVAKTEPLLISHQLFPDVKLTKPLHVFNPTRTTGQIDVLSHSPRRGPSKFTVSCDFHHIGLFHESYLYMWNLTTYVEEVCVDLIELNFPSDTQCIAIGSLYAVLASNSSGVCSVVGVKSGDILTSGTLADITFNPTAQHLNRFNFFSPLVEGWLSSLRYFDFLPLAVVFDNSSDSESAGKELQAVVGVHSQRPKPHLKSLGLTV